MAELLSDAARSCVRISLEIDHLFRQALIGDFASVTTRFAARDHLVLGAIVLGRIKGRLG